MNSAQKDWNLTVAIITLIITIIAGFPGVYDFVERKIVVDPEPLDQPVPPSPIW